MTPSARVQRQIDALLDQTEDAIRQRQWDAALECIRAVLNVDPTNEDALSFKGMAESGRGRPASEPSPTASAEPAADTPSSFANGRYQVVRLLGEGGKKADWWAGWMSRQLLCGDRLLGLLAQTAGQNERATEYFESSLTFCRDAGYRPELAWTAFNYSELLAGEDDVKSSALQDEAIAIAQDLGMKPLLQRVLAQREILKA